MCGLYGGGLSHPQEQRTDIPTVAEDDRSDGRTLGLRQHVVIGQVTDSAGLILDPGVVGH